MKTQLLFPSLFRYIGYMLAVPGFLLGYFVLFQDYHIPGLGFQMRQSSTLFLNKTENFTNELALTLVVTGLLFIAFAKTRREDELTAKIRLNALYWGILVNYAWYGAFISLAGINVIIKSAMIQGFIDVIGAHDMFLVYNFFTPLLIFILRFYYLLYKNEQGYTANQIHLLKNKPFNVMGKWLSLLILTIVIVNLIASDSADINKIFWLLPMTTLLWVYAKEKDEDEYIQALRLDAMQVAIYTNYAILLLSNFLFYGLGFLLVQIINQVTIPLIFQARFQYLLYRLRQQDANSRMNLNCL